MIRGDVLYPLSFDAASTPVAAEEYLRDPAVRLIAEFFRSKGLEALKREDQEEQWHQDWIDYQARHGLYASLLSPQRYSTRGNQISLLRLTRCAEVLGYFSPAHGYSLQVSFLGLFPILLSANEDLKREAIARLEGGGLFAFGVSEKAHGSDLFANEFTVQPAGESGQVAGGAKYYIGNANSASIVTVLAKEIGAGPLARSRRAPFIFFALRPAESPAYKGVRKIRTLGVRSAFVGEFQVQAHPLAEADIVSRGRDAWEAVHATVNLGKFFLGFGSIGICEHAFAEALAHLRRRVLYGKPVTEMAHIRATMVSAFARLAAMKLFAYRALDYLQVAGPDERRFLLFNAVQKAKVSTEGVKVIGLLSECIGARGFESESFFESALRDIQMIPSLEGSTHINFGLTAQFAEPYFTDSEGELPAPPSLALGEAETGEPPTGMQIHDRTARTVRFAPALRPYRPHRAVLNSRIFARQVAAFRRFVRGGIPAADVADAGLNIGLGKCLATIAYAQLVAELGERAEVGTAAMALIFHGLIEDLTSEALKLAAMFPARSSSRRLLKRIARTPDTRREDLESAAEFIMARYGGPS